MSLRRLSVLGAVAAVLVTGCGSSRANSASPTTVSTSTTTPSTSTLPPAPIGGKTVTVTYSTTLSPDNHYVLSTIPITTSASVTSNQGTTLEAPPGQEYLTTTVTIRTGGAGAPEPDIVTDNISGPFIMAIPTSEASASGDSITCDTPPTSVCMMSGNTRVGQETPPQSDPLVAQLAPGSTTTVVVYAGPLPSSVSASSANLYFENGSDPAVQIPAS